MNFDEWLIEALLNRVRLKANLTLKNIMKTVLFLSVVVAALLVQNVSAQLIESFENTLDAWNVVNGNYTAGFSTTTGVTDGSYSLSLAGTTAPNYGQILDSPSTTLLTSELAGASALSFDVYTPGGAFGYYLQFDVDINNSDTGYVSLDGYSYQGVNNGAESTVTVPISASLQSALAASSNPTEIDIQAGGGFSAGNETFYLDNVRLTPAPEPATLALFSIGMVGVKLLRRRKV
jgi:hypothetical protein